MIAEHTKLSPAEMRERASAWFDQQVEILARIHGPSWPEHKEWLEAYLREELRLRLIELGWRPKR